MKKTQRLAHDLGLNHWQDFTESARWHLKSPTTWANAEQALQTHSAMLLSLTITSVTLLRKRPDPSLCCPNKLDRRRWGVGWSWIAINTHLRLSKKNTWHLLIHLERHVFKSILYCKQNWRKFMTQFLVSKQSRLLHSQHNRCFLNLSLRWLRKGSILPSNSLTVIL